MTFVSNPFSLGAYTKNLFAERAYYNVYSRII